MKAILTATVFALLLPSCGLFKENEDVGPYGDKRSRWEKLRTYEEDRYDDVADRWMHREQHQRRKEWGGDSGIRTPAPKEE